MIRLDRIELLHWDMQAHQVLPLARGITLLTGENGSGKTSVLDGIKVALGVARLGGDRDVRKYLGKQARSIAMVRVVADNRATPGTRQRPFDRLGEFTSDLVTLAVVFRAQDEAEYNTEHYLLDGDVLPPLEVAKRGDARPLPSAADYRQRLAKVGLTERYLKLLSLPQGQIAALCKRTPDALFDDLYDIIGGRQTLMAWEERLTELREAKAQHATVERDLRDARLSARLSPAASGSTKSGDASKRDGSQQGTHFRTLSCGTRKGASKSSPLRSNAFPPNSSACRMLNNALWTVRTQRNSNWTSGRSARLYFGMSSKAFASRTAKRRGEAQT